MNTLRIDNIWNFATFNLYTVPAKIVYLQSCSTDFRNLCLSSKTMRVGIWAQSFRCADILLLQWQGENFAHRQHLKFCHFQPVHCARKNPISPKVFTRFSKFLASARRCWGREFGWKFQVRWYFTFALAKWILPHRQHLKFCHFQPVNCPAKILYLQRYLNRFSKSWPVLEDGEGGHLGVKFQVRRYFTFVMARWKLCASTTLEILRLSTCYTVQAKILYLQRYSTYFRNFCLRSKTLRVGIWVESFMGAGVLLLQWHGENIAQRQHLRLCDFQPVHCASKNPISPKLFNRISKSLPQLEDVEGGHLGGKFQVDRCFTFGNGKVKTLRIDNILKFCHFQPVHCGRKNPISPKVFNRFSKSLPQLEDVEGGQFGWKFSGALVFYLCTGKVNTFRIDNIWNFATFTLYTVPAKILCLHRYSTDFRAFCVSSKRLRVGIWVKGSRCANILL